MNKKRKQRGEKKEVAPQPATQVNAFRAAEKKYKHYKTSTDPVDLTDVIDFANIEGNTPENKELIVRMEVEHGLDDLLQSTSEMNKIQMYTLKGYEGFCFICQPFSHDDQIEWAERCLRDYTEPPNITNLNLHYGPITRIWEGLYNDGAEWKEDGEKKGNDDPYRQQEAAKHNETGPVEIKDLPPKSALLRKLRWVTLGYQYNWTDRTYNPRDRFPFPPELARLCERFATLASQSLISEAAIVNFYSTDTVLCGHLDDVEFDFEAPIVSISFGNSAVFLLGGRVREEKPLAMLIRSGDVMIMGGKARLCYHGVPRILENTFPAEECLARLKNRAESAERVVSYLKNSRININARQVLKPGTDFPSENQNNNQEKEKEK